jgi:hypothetical protein
VRDRKLDSQVCSSLWELPIKSLSALGSKVLIDATKWFATEKSAVSRKRRRMGGLQNKVFGSINEMFFLLCVGSPEDKRHGFTLLAHGLNDTVREILPPHLGVGVRSPDSGIGRFRSLALSLKMLRSDGGKGTPLGTEKDRP